MYLHLGNDITVRDSEIVGIFDLDNTTVSKHTKGFLSRIQKENQVIAVTYDLPKSFIVCCTKNYKKACKNKENDKSKRSDNVTVYLSQLSPSTLIKRGK